MFLVIISLNIIPLVFQQGNNYLGLGVNIFHWMHHMQDKKIILGEASAIMCYRNHIVLLTLLMDPPMILSSCIEVTNRHY